MAPPRRPEWRPSRSYDWRSTSAAESQVRVTVRGPDGIDERWPSRCFLQAPLLDFLCFLQALLLFALAFAAWAAAPCAGAVPIRRQAQAIAEIAAVVKAE